MLQIRIHPVKDEPGVELSRVGIESDGLAGDRRKKAAIHLVGLADAGLTRSNLVLDTEASELTAWIGQIVRIGQVRLGIVSTSGRCAGVYADVLTAGEIAVGDPVVLLGPAPD